MRFNDMNFSDGHYVQIPTSWDAQEFTYRFFICNPSVGSHDNAGA